MDLRNNIVTATRYYCPQCDKYPGKSKTGLCKRCGHQLVIQNNDKVTEEMANVPKHIRLSAAKSVATAYKSAITNITNGNIGKFTIKFKSRKKILTDSIDIESKSLKIDRNGFKAYSVIFPIVKKGKQIKKKTLKSIPESIDNDPKINYNYKTKEFFVCFVCKQGTEKSKDNNKLLSNDPGVKTFGTLYDTTTGDCIQLNNRMELLNKLKKKISYLQTYKKPIRKWYKRFNDVISDSQWRMCDFIVSKLKPSGIILPHFESQKMKMSRRRGYNFKLLNVNKHYQFGEKLTWKCVKKGISMIRTGEEYTSKTCGLCGKIKEDLKLSDRIYNCIDPRCSNRGIERDYHAARNIAIRYLCE